MNIDRERIASIMTAGRKALIPHGVQARGMSDQDYLHTVQDVIATLQDAITPVDA